MAVPTEDFRHPETPVLQFPECLESLFFGFEGRAVPSLILKYGAHAVRLDRSTALVTGAAKEFEGLEVVVQTLAIVASLQGCFREIVESLSNLARNVGLLAQLERPFIEGKRIAGLAFCKIDISDIVQAEGLVVLVAFIPLDLQGFLVGLQRLFRLIELFISGPNSIQDRGFTVGVVELDGKAETPIPVIKRAFWIAASDFHPARRQQSVHVFWIECQYPRKFRPRFVVCAGGFV